MIKNLKLLLLYLSLFLAFSEAQSLLVNFRLEIWKDTVYIGEPIILKCWLVNNNDLAVKVWREGPTGLLYIGAIDFYLTSSGRDTSRYAVGIKDFTRQMPSLDISPRDSIYWYSMLCWNNFARSEKLLYQAGEYEIIGRYTLIAKDAAADTLLFFEIISNKNIFFATEIPDSEKAIYNELIPLTREYFWWGERFDKTWTRKDYNDLCKRVADTKSRFAIYAHYIYCKSTGDKNEMQKFLQRYPKGPLSELVEFMLNPIEAKVKYPLNYFAGKK
ncbi:MAG: hypothetical protein ACPL28_11050 [bacterium]